MAITQISKITHRKGLNENLPQLAGAELGWALDARRLYIGNGKIADGAPTIGNTEVLTQHSDILEISSTYTYKGTLTGYEVVTGTSVSQPVTRTLQQKFDDFVSIRDFGVKGDGVTDDTVAINRALSELYTREVNTAVRRSLFFPAGTYKVTDTIKVPSYAKLHGEGAKSTTIKYYSPDGGATVADAVVRTTDSKNQTGVNIGNFGATVPTDIEISSMGFESADDNDILLLESVTNSSFTNVSMKGPDTTATLTTAHAKSCINIQGSALLVPKNITFSECETFGTGFGMRINDKCSGVTLSNSNLSTHYKGVVLGDAPIDGGPTGVRVSQNIFDDILSHGIDIDAVSMNVSAFNSFYDVGNNFNGTGNPFSTVIDINNADNVSIGDMFERTDADNSSFARVFLNEKASIAFDLGKKVELGTYVRDVGKVVTLTDNIAVVTEVITVDLTDTTNNVNIGSFKLDYSIKRGDTVRMGNILIACDGGTPGTLTYDETYNENAVSGIVLTITQTGTTVSVNYTTTNTGNSASLSYSILRLY
jgi:hypothetical protein